jgi:glucokinase
VPLYRQTRIGSLTGETDMNHFLVHMNHKRFNITIHGIEASLYRRLEEQARRRGTSLNRTLKAILEDALGGGSRDARGAKNPFRDLCGTLTADAAAELLEREKQFERIDPEAWS